MGSSVIVGSRPGARRKGRGDLLAEVLCVYRTVKILKKAATATKQERDEKVAVISYDEKPGIQAIATSAPDLPPEPGRHAGFARDHEY